MAQPTMTTKQPVIRHHFVGDVVSVGGTKTIHVRVKTVKMHAKYRKQYMRSKKFAVHDEKAIAKVGDVVTFEECRPLSKTKRWRILEIVT